VLKTDSGLPLVAKFRAGAVIENDKQEKEYVLVFRQTDEIQRLNSMRRIKAMRLLLDMVSKPDMEPDDILLGFARAFDGFAEAMLLPPDFDEQALEKVGASAPGDEPGRLLPQQAIEMARTVKNKKTAALYYDEDLWCFFPVYSQREVYGTACIRFAAPHLYGDEDKAIFSLTGIVLGGYIETRVSRGQGLSAQSLFQNVFDNVTQAIVVVDRNGKITSCNAAARALYGYTASEMTGVSLGNLVFPADSPTKYEDILNRVMQGDKIYDEKTTHVRRNWTMADVSLTASPYRSDDGTIAGALFIIHDLREQKRLQNKMMEWEKLSVLGELLSSVANELNNLLTPMMGYSQLLLQRENDEKIDNMISAIHSETKRCCSIVQGLLDLVREDKPQRKYSNINDIIAAILDLKQYQLRANNIDVHTNLGEGVPRTVADLHEIERLFLHIINYAEQRMMEYDNGGRLTVETSFEEENVIVRFIDTGTCVPGDSLAQILNPFSSAYRADQQIEMGLGVSCQILRDVGGSISIDSQIGKVNVFTIKLPAVKEIPAPGAAARRGTPPRALTSRARETLAKRRDGIIPCIAETRKKVMVVDDEQTIVELLTHLLQRIGYVVDVAGDGNEAMEKLGAGDYDLIISDLKMPNGFTGDKLHEFIKFRDPSLAQRMIFITGDAVNPQTQKFLRSTGNLYLEKPFPIQSFIDIVQRLN